LTGGEGREHKKHENTYLLKKRGGQAWKGGGKREEAQGYPRGHGPTSYGMGGEDIQGDGQVKTSKKGKKKRIDPNQGGWDKERTKPEIRGRDDLLAIQRGGERNQARGSRGSYPHYH